MIIVIENNKNVHFYLFLMTRFSNIRNLLLISLFVKRTREDNFLIKVSSLVSKVSSCDILHFDYFSISFYVYLSFWFS